MYGLIKKVLNFWVEYIIMKTENTKGGIVLDHKGTVEMKNVLDYVNLHFKENIGIEDIARVVGYSPRHCNLMFKNCYGETLASYVRRLRLDAAKEELKTGKPIKTVAKELGFSTVCGFRRAFQREFGILPSDYVKGGTLQERYVKSYEYIAVNCGWGSGENPTADGLWEFSYYDPATKEYALMDWNELEWKYFYAPYQVADTTDRAWYCRNRRRGYDFHPGKEVQAVQSFVCPYSGTVELIYSVGRIGRIYDQGNPCSIQLFLNDTPLYPAEDGML